MKTNLKSIIVILILFSITGLTQNRKEDLFITKKPQTLKDKSKMKNEKLFRPQDGIYGILITNSILREYMAGGSRIGFIFELDISKDSASIWFEPTPIELSRNYLSFAIISDNADLTDVNQYRLIRLLGRLPKGIYKVNVFTQPFSSGIPRVLLVSFTMDFSSGSLRYEDIYKDKILPLKR